MKIFVKALRKTIALDVRRRDIIATVKDKIHDEEGIHPSDQRLIFDYRQLADSQILADGTITRYSTLYLTLGMPYHYYNPAYQQFDTELKRSDWTGKGVNCPYCQVQANVYYSNTEDDEGCVFYKCPYFSVGGCQFVHCADMLDEGLQRRVEHTQETSCVQGNNMSLVEERMQRILDHMKWMEQFLIVCIIARVCCIYQVV